MHVSVDVSESQLHWSRSRHPRSAPLSPQVECPTALYFALLPRLNSRNLPYMCTSQRRLVLNIVIGDYSPTERLLLHVGVRSKAAPGSSVY